VGAPISCVGAVVVRRTFLCVYRLVVARRVPPTHMAPPPTSLDVRRAVALIASGIDAAGRDA
jgi:hypothetical protein